MILLFIGKSNLIKLLFRKGSLVKAGWQCRRALKVSPASPKDALGDFEQGS